VPKVSVVIPTLNRADLLARTIDHIEAQTVPHELYEVIVVDNGSKDHTRDVLSQKVKRYANLRLFSQDKPGAAATRNVGIRAAEGETVLFIDDDILAEPNLIKAHLEHHQKNDRASIIGAVVTPWGERRDPFLRYLRDRAIFNPYSLAGSPMDFSCYHTGNVSTSRALLNEVGGFNEGFSVYGMEDIELGYRLEKRGCRMVHGSDARAVHQYFPTYDHFIRRCEQAGYSLGKLIELHPELRKRFVENGKRTRLLKRFHVLYKVFYTAASPATRLLSLWDERRGTGPVMPLMDLHFCWSVRYHFFLGFSQYTRDARDAESGPGSGRRVQVESQSMPKLAMERRKVI
jgi:glycosyltransferase involved in cell wall biosynthesis